MKYLVIFYLLQPFIDSFYVVQTREDRLKQAEIYQKLIHFRYRDFEKVFVLFSESADRKKPDCSNIWTEAPISSESLVLPSGVTFKESQFEKIEAEPRFVFNQLSKPIREVVVTGLHLSDVDRFAGFVHGLEIHVRVDEDLTELFFMRSFFEAKHIPRGVQASIVETREALQGSTKLYEIRQQRRSKPWFIQV
ncbi:MAG: hypothetical protein KJI69_01395 [Patescibacteria group bacterium]|nr:hypothetical protein [Patescibacteria group bacterium]